MEEEEVWRECDDEDDDEGPSECIMVGRRLSAKMGHRLRDNNAVNRCGR